MNYFNLKTVFKTMSLGILVCIMIPMTSFAQHGKKFKSVNKKVVVERTQPKKVVSTKYVRVNNLPQKSRLIKYRNNNYYYNNGLFYRPSNGAYIITPPPIGMRVPVLPSNPLILRSNGSNYFYQNGTYYKTTIRNEYKVVNAPIGAIIETLPNGYNIAKLNGRTYYRYDETYCVAIQEPDGHVVYKIVEV